MKYTRTIITDLQSKPSFEAAVYDGIALGNPAEETFLALESADLMAEVDGQLDESGLIDDKAERLDVLVDYVDSQVNQDGSGVATPNELALIEQAVDATVDGTGQETETVVPALESATGSQVSLEGLKQTIADFVAAGKELVTGAVKSFGNFMKKIFSRAEAMKARIEGIQKRLAEGELAGEVEVSQGLSVPSAFKDNSFITDFAKLPAETGTLVKMLDTLGGSYQTSILNQHDSFIKDVQKLLDEGRGRTKGKKLTRDELEPKMIAHVEALVALNKRTFKEGKGFGGSFVSFEPERVKTDTLDDAAKTCRHGVAELYRAGNINGKVIQMTGISKDAARRLLNEIKAGLTKTTKVKMTDTMWAVDYLTNLDLGTVIFEGISTSTFLLKVNAINRGYITSYLQPTMRYIDHFFRVASAQLSVLEKAVK